MKTISDLYFDAYKALAIKQNNKYGNPTAEQMPAPNHVPTVLQNAVETRTIKSEHARKLAMMLGRKAYNEVGLTSGVVSMALRATGAIDGVPWHLAGELEAKLCGHY